MSSLVLDSRTGARYLELPSEVAEYRRIFAGVYASSVPISDYTERREPADLE